MPGDFIYETDTAATALAGRNVYPPKEIVTLQDYRLRYQTYHTDPELVRMRAALPLIEWQPIRQFEGDNQRFYRSFNFGKLLHLSMIDTRYNEREKQ
eukprot:3455-Heterococcus_DN1.PRE.5